MSTNPTKARAELSRQAEILKEEELKHNLRNAEKEKSKERELAEKLKKQQEQKEKDFSLIKKSNLNKYI